MKKRRKVWWIVGGVLGFVVLLFVSALVRVWNSPDERLERALQEIIAENGLVPAPSVALLPIGSFVELSTNDSYVGEPISQENGTEILAQLKDACPSCTVAVETRGRGMKPVLNVHAFYTPEDSNFDSVVIMFDDKGVNLASPVSEMLVVRKLKRDPWSFFKNLWPW